MKKFIAVVLAVFLPAWSHAGLFEELVLVWSTPSLLAVEQKILANQFNEAEAAFRSLPEQTIEHRRFKFEHKHEVFNTIEFLKNSAEFSSLMESGDKNPSALLSFYQSNVKPSLNALPSRLPFSAEVAEKVNSTVSRNNDFVKKLNFFIAEEKRQKEEAARLRAEEAERARAAESARVAEEYRRQEEESRKAQEAELRRWKEEEAAQERAYRAEMRKIEAQERAAEATWKKREGAKKAKVAALKKECGSDYRKIRVGMSISRVQHCYPGTEMISQLHNDQGVLIDIYQNGPIQIGVVNGRVASWMK